ncbi:homogentisate 1,2-dioxygenase [Streptomyces clavuligerus]|uniref:Homogentisate 1,2-dioxygenase n=1 Tax=Streptomyces clavuligerus TaxID=1901 RepID=D5SLA8_STRCL|nr:homogentisate 1,2-dioxygenase [Streptomyces clavuligerus]AXU16952.1 homogentisate 1,2-dioxygenase [Streptomyces clavuligerus]AXU17456.1 homogentisate 1,2-dioxygenase [Streptomyces clavuligerus]EFG04701.1 Homogentisate 1,2-dioxygenase [Streptomyces clavuligerus]MBY6306852.1 homogentisate 1,2-dioxygenase [Streptomyces clavuligerus]QCS10552.1 homogentisate 1,2-dioxygenase [Streptomyces clavuligerus]
MQLRPMRSWIHHSRGKVLRQAVTGRRELGGLYEDMLTRQGFEGRDAYLYRRAEPTAWKHAEEGAANRTYDGQLVEPTDRTRPDGGPLRLFHHPALAVSVSRRGANMPFSVRNVDGDELYFVHEGTGTFYTEFGPIPYEPGDYILLPKGVTYRIRPSGPVNYFLVVESAEELGFADTGVLGRRAPFDPGLLYIPSPELDELGDGRDERGTWPVRLKIRDGYASLVYDADPIDVEGWSGDLFPFKLNIRDYRPVMSDRIHVMPSAYAVFATSTFMVGNFLPRPFETAPDAAVFPPYHRNVDYDEFTFFHGGTVLGMPIAPATMALVPQGLHHGLPAEVQAQVTGRLKPGDRIDTEVVFVDTTVPLTPTPEAEAAQRHAEQESGAPTAPVGDWM